MSRALLLGLLALASPAQKPVSGDPEHHLVRVAVADEEALARLLRLDLDPASALPLAPVSLDANGYGAVEVQIPDNLALVGNTFHWQMVYQAGGALSFSNLQTLTLK